jgi:periplasmic protein TonB
MKKLIAAIVLFLCIYNCSAQIDTTKKIGTISIENNAIVDSAVTGEDLNRAFQKVEIESKFPGGERAWISFLQENLKYPAKARRKNIQGAVVLQFIVGKDGVVQDLEAISGPTELRQAALDAMKKTPNWVPAMQGGRKVKSYKKQPIVFRLEG